MVHADLPVEPKPPAPGLLARAKRALARRLLPFVLRHEPEWLTAKVNERAIEVAVPMVMAAMTRAGMVRCHLCPNKRGPLRKIGGMMACPKHVPDVQRLAACETERAAA